MQPRSSSSLGCSGILSVLFFLFASYGFLRLIAKVPARAYTPLEIWTACASYGIPLSYVLMLFIGLSRPRTLVPDPDSSSVSAIMFNNFRESRSEQIYALIAVIFGLSAFSGISWSVFNQILTTTTPVQLQWWAALATMGTLLAGFIGYRLGATPIEGQRRIALAGFIPLLFLFSLGYGIYLWSYRSALPFSFWASLPFGLLGVVSTWRYFVAGWRPATLSWDDTWIDRRITPCGLLVVGLLLSAGGTTLSVVFGDRGWIAGGLLPWILFLLGYMTIQAWRHRPR
jgi:hypothetical protein